jgi:hypothetical protein
LVLNALGGLNVLQPRSKTSPLTIVTLCAVVAALLLSLLDAAHPVRTTIYLLNGDAQPLELGIGEDAGCLLPRSYAVVTWRGDAPKSLTLKKSDADDNVDIAINPGVWLINLSTTKVSADIVDAQGRDAGAVRIEDQHLVRIRVGSSKIYRVFSGESLDRFSASDSDIALSQLTRPCHKS